MTRIIILLFFINCHSNSHEQVWSNIPGTKIQFSNFTKPDNSNWYSVHYEYFKKDSTVIGVSRGLTEDFYSMFQETPIAFDSIFNNASQQTTPDLDSLFHNYDTSILKIKFKKAVIIQSREITYGFKETIWQLTNYSWSYPNYQPCFVNIVFKTKKKSKNKYYNLIFLTAFDSGCDI